MIEDLLRDLEEQGEIILQAVCILAMLALILSSKFEVLELSLCMDWKSIDVLVKLFLGETFIFNRVW